jgi:hypothetical protein
LFSQDKKCSLGLQFDYFSGNVLPHAPDLQHLVTGHPSGLMLSFVKKTDGTKDWHRMYNYPDHGAYFIYQDLKNSILGNNYGIGAYYNFYFLKRNLSVKLSQGLAYNTNPHDSETNNKNLAFGSAILFNTNLFINFKKENVIDKFGFQVGVLFTHFSNGRTKSPNSGINTYNFNLGLNHNFDDLVRKKDTLVDKKNYSEPIKFNFVFRTGVDESPTIGSGQKPFYHISSYIDKRVGRKSAFQFGVDLFLTQSRKEYIKYRSIAFPETNVDINTDYKRVGVFVGHELFINRISIETQVGYYLYQPFKFELPIYDRVGMKYYINNKLYAGWAIKTHGFLAEASEFSIGYRL